MLKLEFNGKQKLVKREGNFFNKEKNYFYGIVCYFVNSNNFLA